PSSTWLAFPALPSRSWSTAASSRRRRAPPICPVLRPRLRCAPSCRRRSSSSRRPAATTWGTFFPPRSGTPAPRSATAWRRRRAVRSAPRARAPRRCSGAPSPSCSSRRRAGLSPGCGTIGAPPDPKGETMSNPAAPKVTYATLAAGQTPEFTKAFDEALDNARKSLGRSWPMFIGGKEVQAKETFGDTSPSDTRVVLGRFQSGTREDARNAIAAARKAYEGSWRRMAWKERVAHVRRLAGVIEKRRFEIAAALSLEVGKNRLEAMGDAQETADLISYYCDQVEKHQGYEQPMETLSDKEQNRDVLRPYGVWVIIAPFNFPMALAGGPTGGALLGGNTVVFKPATDTPWSGALLNDCAREAGLPEGVFNYVTGPGSTVGEELVTNPDVDGILFTGSRDVGFSIHRKFSTRYPKPCITEMGGKNPAIVAASADIDEASEGVLKSAFGLQGQKCSACSRIYV